MRRWLLSLAFVAVSGLLLSKPASALEQFNKETQAQQHCPNDTVVWLNIPSMIWHYKGQRYYGKTRNGAYVCEKEAAAAGARATKNGE